MFKNTASIIIVLLLIAFSLAAGWWLSGFTGGLAPKAPVEISNHNIVLEKIEQIGKLELVRYKFKDVLEYNVKYDWWPDSKAILIISGEAVGCLDFTKIKAEDVQEAGDTIRIRLPEPEICNYKINHKESKVYDTKSYSFDEGKVLDKAFKAAEKKIKQVAEASNILEQTRNIGEKTLRPLFEQLSQKTVIFTYAIAGDKSLKKD